MKFVVHECSDEEIVYGVLSVKGKTCEEVQRKISEIKNEFFEQNCEDWCINDVFERFPESWEWKFEDIFKYEHVVI